MMWLVLGTLWGGCALWDDAPFETNVANLTDADADGHTLAEGDCNDADPDVHPDAVDGCDGVDNDCDGEVDEVLPDTVWCQDVDGDGFGDIAHQTRTCFPETGWVQDCMDCDDAVSAVNPDAVESCNGVDDDCDGSTDPDDAVGSTTWYPDTDGDGYGSAEGAITACEPPGGFVADNSDCDDSADDTYPSAPEICNDGRDNNCDGSANGCGWAGERVLDTAFASYVAGPDANYEALGFALTMVDGSGDDVPDLIFSGFGSMYGDHSAGDVHFWYGAPSGVRSVYEADGHVYGVADAFVGVAEWGAPARPLDIDGDGADEMILAGGGWSDEYGVTGVLFAVETPVYGEAQLTSDAVWAAGMDEYEGFGAGFRFSDSLGGAEASLVVAAPENDQRGNYAGAVYVIPVDTPDAASATGWILGEEGDSLGLDVAEEADVDGDGVDDLVLSSSYRTPPAVFVFHGPLVGERLEVDADAELVEAKFGAEDAFTVPDLTGDGLADIAIQSFRALNLMAGTTSGSVVVADTRMAYLESGRDQQTSIGMAVSAGDIGQDGELDLVVGLPEADVPADLGGIESAGAVVVVPYSSILAGANDAWEVSAATFFGRSLQGYVGARLTLGDANADGHPDLLTSAMEADERGYQANGGVWFLLGGGI